MKFNLRRHRRRWILRNPKKLFISLTLLTASMFLISRAVASPGITAGIPAKGNFIWSVRIAVVPNGRLDNILQRMRYKYKHGSLLDLNGHILKKDGGVSPVLSIGFGKRPLAVEPGSDRIEPVQISVTQITPLVKQKGTGAFFKIEQKGQSGRIETEKGRYSGIVRKKSEFPAKDRIYKRYNPKSGKYVALTFDDGPYPETPKVLDILDHYDIKATFFWIGKHVEKYPEIARLVVKKGHEVGNHTYSHSDLANASRGHFKYELLTNEKLIRRTTGYTTRLYRPVAGHYSAGSVENAFSMGYKPILWSEDSRDWKKPGVQAIVSGAMPRHSETAVILLHDGGGDRTETLKALPYIIKAYKSIGYSFVTVSELLDMENAGKHK